MSHTAMSADAALIAAPATAEQKLSGLARVVVWTALVAAPWVVLYHAVSLVF